MILAINTATSATEIALLDENDQLVAEDSWTSKNDEAEKLMPAIDALISENNCSFDDLQEILVVRGPGSFTGLRVGITVANMISYLNKTRLYALNTFQYMWQKMEWKENRALLIFAGSGGVYVSFVSEDPEPEIINNEDLADFLKENHITEVFGDISEDQKGKKGDGVNWLDYKLSFGQTLEKYLKEQRKFLEDHTLVKPHYVKSPSITKAKKIFG